MMGRSTSLKEIASVVAAVCFLWRIDAIWGQSVTETSIVNRLGSDYQYENVPSPGLSPSNNASTNNNDTKTAAGEDGLFYPLYGDALSRNKQREGSLQSVPRPSTVPDFYDYTGGDKATLPNTGRVGAQGSPKGPTRRADWIMELIRGSRLRTNQNARFGGVDRRLGGDVMETLREEFLIISRFGLTKRLDDLQRVYPHVNVTRLYNSYQQEQLHRQRYGNDMRERGSGIGYWHNGTFHFYNNEPYFWDFEADDGFWHNGTFYPLMDEGMDDGFWHNGTFYPLMDEGMDDGFWYNGTFYPGDLEGPDIDDGFFYNGTFYHMDEMEGLDFEDGYFHNGTFYPLEYEDLEEGRDWYEEEDLMWWQRHHPRWQDRTNNIQGPPLNPSPWSSRYPQAFPFPIKQDRRLSPYYQRPPFLQSTINGPGNPFLRQMQNQRQQWKQIMQGTAQQRTPGLAAQQRMQSRFRPFPEQWRQRGFRRYPMRQYGSSLPPNPNNGRFSPFPSTSNTQPGNSRIIPGFAESLGMRQGVGNVGPRSSLITPPGSLNVPANAPGAEAIVRKPVVHKNPTPLEPYSDASTAAIGIVFACVLGLTLILAPLVCMLHTYRQNKKMKKRTLLRRPELSGSVDEGLVDAMVRSELGAIEEPETPRLSMEHEGHQSSGGKNTAIPAKVKSKGGQVGERRWKNKKGWQKGHQVKTSRGHEMRSDLEMKELRGATSASSRPLPPCPPSSSTFLARHNRYTPRNTVIGAKEELREEQQRSMAQPMSIVGMESEDEIKIV